MRNTKFDKLLCIFCWFGVLMTLFIEGYMLYMVFAFPEIDSFRRYALLVAPLLLLWLGAAVWFTVQAMKGNSDS